MLACRHVDVLTREMSSGSPSLPSNRHLSLATRAVVLWVLLLLVVWWDIVELFHCRSISGVVGTNTSVCEMARDIDLSLPRNPPETLLTMPRFSDIINLSGESRGSWDKRRSCEYRRSCE
ncbi:hypothetical protein EYF80_008057 [Liparis tanakae]|uniref:Uncharacterized protein n=1 Tax=Liparis tanakae TaxID=230148 RepID=A0A4Z2IUV9_9TELE|nr:hypothetical protein EYF80_008057 [Liparis tanakae]